MKLREPMIHLYCLTDPYRISLRVLKFWEWCKQLISSFVEVISLELMPTSNTLPRK